jgi:tryptophan-rich sensory protein
MANLSNQFGAALFEAVVLWAFIGATLLVFAAVVPVSAALMAPYWAWVTFATVPNTGFRWLNLHSSGR